MNFFQITKQKIKILLLLAIIAAVCWFAFNFLFGCLAILTSEPYICHSLSYPVALINIFSLGVTLPGFLLPLYFDVNHPNDYVSIAFYIGLILEIFYLYFMVCLYANRKIIAEKVPKLLITVCILTFLYFSWIVLFDIPNLDRSYSYGESSMSAFKTYKDPETGLIEKDYNSVIEYKAKGYYSLIWPWAIYKGNRSYPLNRSVVDSLGALIIPIIYLILLTVVVQKLFFKKALYQ